MMDLEKIKECLKNGWIEGKPYIFISYASKDKEKVYRFVYELRKLGINVYIDLELQENIAANWLENIKNRLYDIDCKAMVSFLSMDYLRSYACLIEQLMTRSEDLKEEKGKFLHNVYVTLDETMGSMQGIENIIYKDEIVKEGQKEIIKMVPEEIQILKAVIENNAEKTDDIKKMLSKVDAFKTKHNVATFMFHYVFKGQTFSIQPYDTAEKCADLLYRNCTNEKNEVIHILPLEELKEEYEMYSSKFNMVTPKVTEEVPVLESEEARKKEMEEEGLEEPEERAKEEPKEKPEEKPVEEIISEKNHTENKIEKKVSSTTGDITFTLYGKEYTLNQSDMMLTFFAQVLSRHTQVIDSIFQYKGMNCVSELDYTQKHNRENGMPSYFRNCEFFTFPTGEKICVGTSYSIGDKLKKMAILLEICEENTEIFSSSQVSLPSAKAEAMTGGTTLKGKSSLVQFRIFGEAYEQNQSDMLGTVCSTLLKKHPDKLEEAADTLLCIDTKDYRMVEKEDRPVYFSSMNYYEINGMPCTVGGSFGMKEKLKMIGKLLVICGEHTDCIEMEGYEIPASALGSSRSKNINYFG